MKIYHLPYVILSTCVAIAESCTYAIKEAPVQKMFNTTFWADWELPTAKSTWSSKDGVLTLNGEPFYIRGANFNGFETTECRVPLGLSDKPLSFFLDFLKEQQFNVLRIPLSYEIMANLQLQTGYCTQSEPRIKPGHPVGMALRFVMDEAWTRGIRVIVDLHTIGGVITPLPWTDTVNENMVTEAWLLFLKEFHAHPALIGIEIKNEPHDTISLPMFLEHCTKVIQNVETYIPEYKGLYFISGIQNGGPWGGSFDQPLMTRVGFQGMTHPSIIATIKDVRRLVLTPHIYGTSVRGEDVGTEGPDQWEAQYGFLSGLPNYWNETVIIPTEIGGLFTDTDKQYYDKWADWHVNQKNFTAGAFWWTLAPFSKDTGGIFNSDYSVNWDKVHYMKTLVPNPTFSNKKRTLLKGGRPT